MVLTEMWFQNTPIGLFGEFSPWFLEGPQNTLLVYSDLTTFFPLAPSFSLNISHQVRLFIRLHFKKKIIQVLYELK